MTMDGPGAVTGLSGERQVVDETAAVSVAACLFHGLSDPSRLAIVRHLALGEHRVVDLTEHVGLAQSTVSKHLACLRDCGLVESRPQGRASLFRLAHPEVTLELLAAAERLLALTGDAVALCPTYGRAAQQTTPQQTTPQRTTAQRTSRRTTRAHRTTRRAAEGTST